MAPQAQGNLITILSLHHLYMAAAEAHRASAAVIAERKRTTNFVLAVRFFYVESCRFSLAAVALRFRHLRIFQNDGMEETTP